MALRLVSHDIKSRTSTLPKVLITLIIVLFTLATTIFFLFSSAALSLLPSFSTAAPEPPTVHLDALLVSRLNVSGAALAADFDARLTVGNPNAAWTVSAERVESFVTYKESAVAVSSAAGFTLAAGERTAIRVRISTTGLEGDQPKAKEWVLKGIRNELCGGGGGGGGLRLAIQMAVWATYRDSIRGARKHVVVNPKCELRVRFAGQRVGLRLGWWVGERPMWCSVPVQNE